MIILERALHERPWGRRDLPDHYGAQGRMIGEIWHQRPGADLPVLVKSIFTAERLSVQVHPDDASARRTGLPSGKEEWWLVTAAAPDSTLGIGLNSPHSREALREAASNGSIIDLMAWFPVRAGDFFHIPPGTVHAIGAGVNIVEVQQNADVTFRMYDYGRGRALHLDAGIAVAQAVPHPARLRGSLADTRIEGQGPRLLTRCPHFSVFHADAGALDALAGDDAQIVPLTGEAAFGERSVGPGAVLWGDPGALGTRSPDFTCLVVAAHRPS